MGQLLSMKLVVFSNNHELDLSHEIKYYSRVTHDIDNTDKVVEEIKEFAPDLIIEEEKNDGVSNYTEIYKKLPKIPKAWWAIDLHCNLIDHVVYAKQFDYIFAAQSWFIPILNHEVLYKVFYLPLCHSQTITEYQEMLQADVEKDIDFSFVGNIRSIHVERAKYVNRFLKMYPDTFLARQAPYENTLQYLRRSKATFNCSLNNDLNFRVWEALACNAIPVTDYVHDIQKIHGLWELLVMYDKMLPDWQNLTIPFNDFERSTQDFIKSNHTMTHRMNQLIEMVETNNQYIYG